jgi:hypothetical protein
MTIRCRNEGTQGGAAAQFAVQRHFKVGNDQLHIGEDLFDSHGGFPV